MEGAINVKILRSGNDERIDRHTYNGMAIASEVPYVSYPVTVRSYKNRQLAQTVYSVSKIIDHHSVAKSLQIIVPDSGKAHIIFEPFYKYTFAQWANTSPNDNERRKTMRSIVDGVDRLHRLGHFKIGLNSSIRVNEENIAQIVLDTEGTDLDTGIAEDMDDFISLVNYVFEMTGGLHSAGYQFFNRINRHYSNRKASRQLSPRTYLYLTLHSPLFYEVDDRYYFMYKLRMFRDMNEKLFDKKLFGKSNPPILQQNWWEVPGVDPLIIKTGRDEDYMTRYDCDGGFLVLHRDCEAHIQKSHTGLSQLQEKFDTSFPDAIYSLFYHFVKKIADKTTFENIEVIEYLRNTPPNSGFLRDTPN